MMRRWSTLPLRLRLVIWGVLGLLIGFGIGGCTLVGALHFSLQHSVDAAATKTADDVAALLRDGQPNDQITTGRDNTVVQVYDNDGSFSGGSLGAEEFGPLLSADQIDSALNGRIHTIDGAKAGMNDPLRVTATPAVGHTVIVGVSQSEVSAVPKLAFGLAITLGVLVVVLAVVLWWLVGRTLRPVEAARVKQRAFVADAAHELRSPLANLRTELEVAQRIGAPDDLLRDLMADVDRLSRITEDLLLLARLDDARASWRPEDLDLTELFDVVRDSYADARVPVTVTGDEGPLPLRVDRDGLQRLFTNLIDNAVRHAETGVRIESHRHEGGVTTAVIDDGPGIPVTDRQRVFNRFTRLDNARGRDSGGTGLGLSIVAELVSAHDGSITLRDAPGHGLRVEVWLPATA